MSELDTPRITTPDRRGSGAFKWDLAADREIPMWVADMDFSVAPEIVTALQDRLQHPVFGYTGVPDSYREAVAQWEQKRNGWEIELGSMVVVPSVMPALAVAVEAMTEPGDRIATFSPVYYPFFETIEAQGRVVERIPLAGTDQYHFDLAAVERVLPRVKLVLLCSPHNPGGRVWRRDELAALRDRAEHAGVPVLSDEIHSDLVFPGETFVPWLSTGGATERDMALIAPSKTFNIPGLPTATAVVPHASWRQQYKAALNAHMLRLPNLLAITAAEAAYRHGAAWLDQVRSTIFDHYHVVRSTLAEEPGVVVHRMEGTFIAWIDLRERWSTLPPRDGSRSERFGAFARTQGVWLSDGRHFGPEGEGCMRMNVATSRETLEEGLRRFRGALTAFDAQESTG